MIFASNILVFGLAALFAGAYIFDFVIWTSSMIFMFVITANILSSWGGMEALEDHSPSSTARTVYFIISLAVVLILSLGYGFFSLAAMPKFSIGMMFGYILSYNFYLFLFGWWVDNYTWMLWIFLLFGMIYGGLKLTKISNSESEPFIIAAAMISSYTIIRAHSLYQGGNGIPNEFEIMNIMNTNNHTLSFGRYLFNIVVLLAGTVVGI